MTKKTRFIKLLLLVLAAVFVAQAAWAANLRFSVWHETHTPLKLDGNKMAPDYTKTDFSQLAPRMTGSSTRSPGEFVLSPDVSVKFGYGFKYFDSDVTWPPSVVASEDVASGPGREFATFPENRGNEIRQYIASSDLRQGAFIKPTPETAFNGTKWSYENKGGTQSVVEGSEGTFPNIVSTDEWLEQVVPYVELHLDSSGKKVTGATWRFVNKDAPNTPLRTNASEYLNIGGIGDGYLNVFNKRTGHFEGIPLEDMETRWSWRDGGIPNNTELAGQWKWTGDLELENVLTILISFGLRSGSDNVSYGWHFNNLDFKAPTGGGKIGIELPTPADIPVAKQELDEELVKAGMTGNRTVTIISEDISVQKGFKVDFSEEIPKTRMVDAISFEQMIPDEGGAVLVGKLIFPMVDLVNDSMSEETPPPLSDSIEGLRGYYKVMKYFDDGRSIDLLDIPYGEKLFDKDAYETSKDLKLKRTLVIVDDVAPSAHRIQGSDRYGIWIPDEPSTFFYVFDGHKDGFARDPIALEFKGGSGSSSGCSATGLGFCALIALASFALIGRRKD